MMSLDYMQELADDAAKQAKRIGTVPYAPTWRDIERGDPIRDIPFLGDYVPKGWEVVDIDEEFPHADRYKRGDVLETNIFFVDASGFGGEDEPAMTPGQFLEALRPGFGYAIVEVGQFQVCIRAYRRKKS